jgi:outer membrane protein TolC
VAAATAWVYIIGKHTKMTELVAIADADAGRARAELDVARADAVLASANLQRVHSVADARAVSSERIDTAQAAADTSRAAVSAAQTKVRSADAQARVREARALSGIAGAGQFPVVNVETDERTAAYRSSSGAGPTSARRIAAANARIGVVQADLYPHFSLTGAAGLESLNLSSFSSASSGYYQIGPNFRWMIFDAGRVRFQIQAESARTAAARAIYERSVLGALGDVEAALVSYANTQMSRDKFAAESAEDREAVDIARLLYERGIESFLPVLDAERSLYAADDKLAQSERDATLALVALYKSLGGGSQTANAGMSEHSAAYPAK